LLGRALTTHRDGHAAGVSQVADALPHRYPMLLVDRILELVPDVSITAVKAVTVNEPWFAGHGAAAAYPQVLLIESWCQAACILTARPLSGEAERADGGMPLLGALSGVRIRGPVWPGDVLTHRARVIRILANTWMFEGESFVDGTPSPLLEVERLTLALRELDERSGTK